MTDTKIAHTPGPWHIKGSEIVSPASGTTVATAWEGAFGRDANARLIAAAPDLLAALRRILASWDLLGEGIYHGVVAKQVREAIAKAEGR